MTKDEIKEKIEELKNSIEDSKKNITDMEYQIEGLQAELNWECGNLTIEEKNKQKLLSKYKQKMNDAINQEDEEVGYINCDNCLCELLTELGFVEIVQMYEEQPKWYS